jgi:hypothetical protein
MSDYTRIVGDLSSPIASQLTDINGPIDLGAGDVVTFVSRKLADTTATTAGLAQVVAPGVPVGHPQRGVVIYNPISTDVESQGIYFIHWQVQFLGNPSTILQSFPQGPPQIMVLLPV